MLTEENGYAYQIVADESPHVNFIAKVRIFGKRISTTEVKRLSPDQFGETWGASAQEAESKMQVRVREWITQQ